MKQSGEGPRGRRELAQERGRWEPRTRRDRTTEYRPPWWSIDELERDTFEQLASLHPIHFALVAELCAVKGWPGERAYKMVARAVLPSPTQRRRTTTEARRELGRSLGRRVAYGRIARLVLEGLP